MGQTAGSNAGNLELMKQIKEQQAEIEELKERENFKTIYGNNVSIWYNSTVAFLQISVRNINIKAGNTDENVIATLPSNVRVERCTRTGVLMTSAWSPTDVVTVNIENTAGSKIILRCPNERTNATFNDVIVIPGNAFHVSEN